MRTSSVLCFAATICLLEPCAAKLCALDPDLPGLGEEIIIDPEATKIYISAFSASVSYTVGGSYVKILGASTQPVVKREGSILSISTESCGANPSEGEDPDSTAEPTSSATMLGGLAAFALFAPRGGTVSLILVLTTSFFSNFVSPVLGDERFLLDDGCTPKLEIEISLPPGAETTTKTGETDHYLPANVDTVIWGWYKPGREPVLTMESGETVTMEAITSVVGHDYAKMIRGDPAIEEIMAWYPNETLTTKAEPKLPNSGPHFVTGPIEVVGAEPGDVLQIDILELDPRKNPKTGKTYASNMQISTGYHFRFPKPDGSLPVRGNGNFEAMTIMEFIEDEDSNMLWGKPVYMFRLPNMTLPDGTNPYRDPGSVVPHVYNYGYNLTKIEEDPIFYPPGFDGFKLDQPEIEYISPDPAGLDWKVPLRPHMGILAVTPNASLNWDAEHGLNTVPPARYGGNIDDWRIGKGGTMYYSVEIPGAYVYMGDTHSAQGDSELAGTAMETSLNAKLRMTLHKADNLPKKVAALDFPLLETSTEYVIHGFAYNNFLEDFENPAAIFAEGGSLDLAMEDCFLRTRNWLMDYKDLEEEEVIAIMSMGIDYGVTQVVDGNWGVHASIPKWMFESPDVPFDYSCTTSKTPARSRRELKFEDRKRLLEDFGVDKDPKEYADELYNHLTNKCAGCAKHPMRTVLAEKFLDAKLHHLNKVDKQNERILMIMEHMERHLQKSGLRR